MKQTIILVLLAVILGGVLARELFPRREQVLKPVPQIVTVHDTVHTPANLKTVEVFTTDTVKIVISETLHDVPQMLVDVDTESRRHVWPILNVQIGESRGDTSQVTTFSLISGGIGVSKIWTPGPLKAMWVDSTQTPRMSFYEPPIPPGVSLGTKIKWGGVGAGAAILLRGLVCR